MNVRAVRTRVFKEDEDLVAFIAANIPELKDGSVLAVASKIVALSEGRVARPKNAAERGAIIQRECDWMVATKHAILTMKDGIFMANAGTDESNADGGLILLPKDCFASAENLRLVLLKHYNLKRVGILITDSRVMPLRAGVVGIALGYAGFKGSRDYRGERDIFGRPLKYTQTNIADGLATAAVVVGGEGNEQKPLVVIEDAPIEFANVVDSSELVISPEEDMYQPLWDTMRKKED